MGGPSMRKFMKHALDVLLVCVRVYHVYELWRDRFKDL
jgi:hypothetical protein